jgi:hypothetical protein
MRYGGTRDAPCSESQMGLIVVWSQPPWCFEVVSNLETPRRINVKRRLVTWYSLGLKIQWWP